MKLRILAIVATIITITALVSPVALADDPTDVVVVVVSPNPVDATLNLTGSIVSVSVNGSGLATSDQVSQISDLFQSILGAMAQLQNTQNNLTPQIELHSQAIVKLITEFTFDKENLAVLKSELKSLNNMLFGYSLKGIEADKTLASGIDSILVQIDKMESDFDTFKAELTDSLDSKLSRFTQNQVDSDASLLNQINELQTQVNYLSNQYTNLEVSQQHNKKNANTVSFIITVVMMGLLVTQHVVLRKKIKIGK